MPTHSNSPPNGPTIIQHMRLPLITLQLVLGALSTGLLAQTDSLTASLPAASEYKPVAPTGSLETVMNKFMAAYAGDHIEWRSSTTTANVSERSPVPTGWQKGKTESGIWYLFLPKTADMLTPEQRRGVVRDPRFPKFIAQLREIADGKAQKLAPELIAASQPTPAKEIPEQVGRAEILARLLAGRRPPPESTSFEITPEELILPGAIVITLKGDIAP